MTSGEVIISTLFKGASLSVVTATGVGAAAAATGAGAGARAGGTEPKDIVLSLPIAAASSVDLPPMNCGI